MSAYPSMTSLEPEMQSDPAPALILPVYVALVLCILAVLWFGLGAALS